MHTAPAVDYPVARSRVQGLLLLAIWLCLVVVYGLWIALADGLGWRQWLGLSVAVAGALTLIRAWRSAPLGCLCWDGRSWWWESNGARVSGVVAPALDLQFAMLLGFRPLTGAWRWFWLERNASAMRWSALRRAVAARGQDFGVVGDDALAVQPLPRGRSSTP